MKENYYKDQKIILYIQVIIYSKCYFLFKFFNNFGAIEYNNDIKFIVNHYLT